MGDTRRGGIHHLTALFVKRVTAPGKYGDGNGLYLRVNDSGSKQWIQRLMVGGRRRELGLGGWPVVSLADAREAAMANRRAARQGEAPATGRRDSRDIPVFSAALVRRHAELSPGWSSDKFARQWLEMMRGHTRPLSARRIDQISAEDVREVILAVWQDKPPTGRKLKQRLADLFSWAMASGWRADNPVDVITPTLPRQGRTETHYASVPYAGVPAAMRAVLSARARLQTRLGLGLVILTASRTGEVRGARAEEFDLEAGIWTIPAARMKTRKEHRVPLSGQAAGLVRAALSAQLPRDEVVFAGQKGQMLSDAAFGAVMRRLGLAGVPHGFRTSFKTWAQEQAVDDAVSEAVLAHTIRNKVEAAYARSDLFARRVPVMQAWADYVVGSEGLFQKITTP